MRLARPLILTAIVAVLALGTGTAAAGPSPLCVGGPHCFATVQAALDSANAGDTVRVGPGTFAGGITITKSVSLVGAGAATKISGGGPVVTIGSATTSPTVTLSDLTITGGVTTTNPQAPLCGADVPSCGPGYANATAAGGGIEAFQGTTVTILHSVVTGNRASPALSTLSVKAVCPGPVQCPASFAVGGGIDNWGSMTLIDTTVSDNHASAVQADGGGIVTERGGTSLTLIHSRVTGNSASAPAPFGRFAQAGGILADHDATLAIEDSQIDGNVVSLASSIPSPYPLQDGSTTTNAFSGGIHLNDDVTATIRHSTLDGNSVNVDDPTGEPFGGDAAMCSCGSAKLTLEHTRIHGNSVAVNVLNTVDSGPWGPGALELDSDATVEDVQVNGNSIDVNASSGDAGALGAVALFFDGDVPPTITQSSISHNVSRATTTTGAATIQGAGLTNNGPLMLTKVDIDHNRGVATGPSGFANGGGIWNGELFGGPDSPLTLVDSHVEHNHLSGSPAVSLQGGGIFTLGFPVTLTGSTVKHNAPDDCFGC